MFPIAFTQMFEFIAPTSILELAITPTFEHFYPPPILTKHPIWYSINADFFIALQETSSLQSPTLSGQTPARLR